MAANLVEADMRGVTSHGHWLLRRYSEWLDEGTMNPRPNVRVVRETAATVLVDGDFGPGHIAGALTMRAVIEKAREAGAATGITRRSRHFGAAAHFALMAVPHEMLGCATTNAGPTMFAFGGRERVVGRFHRSFDLPEIVDSSNIRAETKDGVLRVVLPKLETAQPRQIEVSVN